MHARFGLVFASSINAKMFLYAQSLAICTEIYIGFIHIVTLLYLRRERLQVNESSS